VLGNVLSTITAQRLFWVKLVGRNSEGKLSVISHSIKYVGFLITSMADRYV